MSNLQFLSILKIVFTKPKVNKFESHRESRENNFSKDGGRLPFSFCYLTPHVTSKNRSGHDRFNQRSMLLFTIFFFCLQAAVKSPTAIVTKRNRSPKQDRLSPKLTPYFRPLRTVPSWPLIRYLYWNPASKWVSKSIQFLGI